MTDKVRVQVRVGDVWVPAHLGLLSEEKGKELVKAYRIDRPSAHVRMIPARSDHAA